MSKNLIIAIESIAIALLVWHFIIRKTDIDRAKEEVAEAKFKEQKDLYEKALFSRDSTIDYQSTLIDESYAIIESSGSEVKIIYRDRDRVLEEIENIGNDYKNLTYDVALQTFIDRCPDSLIVHF